jgi:hypothetical protein
MDFFIQVPERRLKKQLLSIKNLLNPKLSITKKKNRKIGIERQEY